QQHLHDTAELIAGDESAACGAMQNGCHEPVKRCKRKNDREVEGEIAGLRTLRGPGYSGAPVIETKERGQGEQRQRYRDINAAIARYRRRILSRSVDILNDDFLVGTGHEFAKLTWRRTQPRSSAPC